MTEGPWLQELVGKGIRINDHGYECPQIELLIGADWWGKLLTARVEQLSCGLTAIETVFGWTVMCKLNLATDQSAAMLVTSLLVGEARLPDLWKLEVSQIKDAMEVRKKETERCVCNLPNLLV